MFLITFFFYKATDAVWKNNNINLHLHIDTFIDIKLKYFFRR